jgi:hypothetical protein
MSEAELHVLRARLRGGILNKARRGELEMRLPIGFAYDREGKVRLDPDLRIQESIRQLFKTFRRTGSASATVRAFREQGLKFPRRLYKWGRTGEVMWVELQHSRVLWVLHNPRYTGAYCFGRSRQRHLPDGKLLYQRLAQEEWTAFIRDSHEGYISWEEFEQNVQRLRENAQAVGADRERGAPREGPALLQGLAICARCGQRMTVRYHQNLTRRVPDYVCQRDGIQNSEPLCQQIRGTTLDDAIGELLIQSVTPLTLEVALCVQQEIERRCDETDRLRQHEVERARYESDLARRRYMQCDPDNRLVTDSLEAEWNQSLRALANAQDRYEKQRQSDRVGLTDEQRANIMTLAGDFPRLWKDPRTPDRERKRMARLLIADITLLKGNDIRAQVRFNGGATHTPHVPLPKPSWMIRQTPAAVVAEIDRQLDHYTAGQVAEILNQNGVKSGQGRPFNTMIVIHICESYRLKSRYDRLRARQFLTLSEIAKRLDVSEGTIKIWRRSGLLPAHAYTDRGDYLFEPPGPNAPLKGKHHLAKRLGRTTAYKQIVKSSLQLTHEVQCEDDSLTWGDRGKVGRCKIPN